MVGKSKYLQKSADYFNNLLYSYSTLLFMKNRFIGLILFGVTFFNLNIALAGLISWAVSQLFSKFIGVGKDEPVNAIYTYNSLLTGFAVGFLFQLSLLSVLLTIGVSILTFLFSYSLFSIFYRLFGLPVLNIPFTVVSTVVFLASLRYSSLLVTSLYPHQSLNVNFFPPFIQGFLRAVGLVMFLPYDIVGLIIIVAILIVSRITFFLAVTSFYLGMFILYLLKGTEVSIFYEIASYNFILIGIAIGGIFLISSKRSYTLALTAVVVSVFIIDAVSVFWSAFGIPVFTLPFNIVVLLYIYVLQNVGHPKMNFFIKESPEASLAFYINNQRFNRTVPTPNLPFFGEWTVYQSFDGEWTHKGVWQYAYDYIITDKDNNSYQNSGKDLFDYYCYNKPIIAPVSGVVVEIVNNIMDNLPGSVNKENNWGNYIIIKSDYGYFVEISHLARNSVKVIVGQYVNVGTPIAECGNSGYSAQPHIHMQVQRSPLIGSPTSLFYTANTLRDKKLLKNENLNKNDKVQPFFVGKSQQRKFQFILDNEFYYDVFVNGKKIDTIKIKIGMDAGGRQYFEDESAAAKLYFGIENNIFMFYNLEKKKDTLLTDFIIALASFPLTDQKNLNWEEQLPDSIVSDNFLRLFVKSFKNNLFEMNAKYQTGVNSVSGIIYQNGKVRKKSMLIFGDLKGIAYLKITEGENNRELILKEFKDNYRNGEHFAREV